MDDRVDMLVMKGVARPCPDCGEERLFVPADLEHSEQSEYCCTWCGAGLIIDPSYMSRADPARQVA